ncbi:hypothetical protein niasHT_007012 [Heterodera trifolii]|uniref:Carboxylesterase type B domain-containing protein n=1 Tax=Heterodera trifolii TaxID=157864 RepID=A0ABD2LXG0_9BILA
MFSSLFLLSFSFFALFLLLIPAFSDPLFPIVPTKFGRVKGFVHSLSPSPSAFRFRSVDVFFGIPFATPPIGEFRFEKPIPPKLWHGVRNAIRPVSPCVPHARELCNKCSEDCLYLNIFTPHQHSLSRKR